MPYLYDGALSSRTMDSIRSMMATYPNPVELSAIPAREVFDLLPEHGSVGEDCMGRSYEKTTRMFGIVFKNFDDQPAGVFVFLKNRGERQTILDACPRLVVNADPFKSIIGG